MEDVVQLLIDVQELDQKILEAQNTKQRLELEQQQLDKQVDQLQTVIDDLSSRIREQQTACEELSQALLQEKANIEKSESRLPGIKTQKEYLAVLKEIDIAKKQIKDLEELQQQKNQAIEELENDQQERQQALDEINNSSENRCGEIRELLGEVEEILSNEDGKRDALIEQVPQPFRSRYELVLKRRNGQAIVEARNYTCTGCHMRLPPQFFNALLKNRGIECCPHCNRMLFISNPED
ncbi:MAG: hypothetical protein JXR59_03825 [Desulfuromonadaceae bacterium]|nr:hypothetical protein [Desulfuromonadaceae bacterium]